MQVSMLEPGGERHGEHTHEMACAAACQHCSHRAAQDARQETRDLCKQNMFIRVQPPFALGGTLYRPTRMSDSRIQHCASARPSAAMRFLAFVVVCCVCVWHVWHCAACAAFACACAAAARRRKLAALAWLVASNAARGAVMTCVCVTGCMSPLSRRGMRVEADGREE
jgi:hypothetical protein